MTLEVFRREVGKLDRWLHVGCGNHDCAIGPPREAGTNGGCDCVPAEFAGRLEWLAAEMRAYGRSRKWKREAPAARAVSEGVESEATCPKKGGAA